MRRKHKKGVVSSVYDYIFFLHPSSSDPRATILLVSDADWLTMYKRACYSRPILKLAFACRIIHMTRTYTSTHMHNMYPEYLVLCVPVFWLWMSVNSRAWTSYVGSLSCQRLWQADRETAVSTFSVQNRYTCNEMSAFNVFNCLSIERHTVQSHVECISQASLVGWGDWQGCESVDACIVKPNCILFVCVYSAHTWQTHIL